MDDDCNGYIDDIHGINAVTNGGPAVCSNPIPAGDPNDEYYHGTHVAGIIGAVGNNGLGTVGVAWRVKMMPLKFLDKRGNGSFGDAIE